MVDISYLIFRQLFDSEPELNRVRKVEELIVDRTGIEPVTSSMSTKRSTAEPTVQERAKAYPTN
jgi:hypothetical protein